MDTSAQGWTQTPPAELIKGTPEWLAVRDAMLGDWEQSKRALEAAKAAEMELRKQVVQFNFNTQKLEGTERVDLANGWQLKAVKKLNYNLVSPVEGVTAVDAVDAALTEIEGLGPDGKFIAERLVKWTPELSISEYRKLDEMPNGEAYKRIIDKVVETKSGAPTLEIVPPKGSKK
jgi:hypothetical protein